MLTTVRVAVMSLVLGTLLGMIVQERFDYLPVYVNWGQYIQVSAENNQVEYYNVPPYFEPPYLKQWRALERQILLSKAKTIVLYWQGNGGLTDQGDKFIATIQKAEAQGKNVILYITGEAVSMHANVACFSAYKFTQPGVLIFHSGYYYRDRNGKKVYSNDRYYFDQCERRGILSEHEINEIIGHRQRVEIYSNGYRRILPDYAKE